MTKKRNNEDMLEDFENISIEDENEFSNKTDGKIEKLKKEIKHLKAQKEEYLLGWQSERADMVNLKKQTEEEKKLFTSIGKKALLLDILPVIDNFEAAFSNKEAWNKVDEAWRKGVEYIYTNFLSILENNGVLQFGKKGDIFDENKYLSIGVVKTSDKNKDHQIESVVQKGYLFENKVIKEAKVKIYSFEKNYKD